MRIIIYRLILEKLSTKHDVSADEVDQAFLNRSGSFAKETRPKNQGSIDRFWFISTTNRGRELKIVFFIDRDEKKPVIITAYNPSDVEVKLYEKIQRKKQK